MSTRLPLFTLLIFTATMLSGCLGVISTTLFSDGPEFEANRAINFKLHANEASNTERISEGQGNILTLHKLVNDQPDTSVNYIASANIEFDGVKQRNWWQWWITYYIGVRYNVATEPLPPGKYQFTVNGYKRFIAPSTDSTDYSITIAASSLDSITHDNITYNPVLKSGRVWLDRNLGALEACQGSDDINCYGCLYPWSDGFNRTDGAMCPAGYRVPSAQELERLLNKYPTASHALNDRSLSIPRQGSSSKIILEAAACPDGGGTLISTIGFSSDGLPGGASLTVNQQNLPPNGLSRLVSTDGLTSENNLICPSILDDQLFDSDQYLIGQNDYATLWSSSEAAHGYHYVFFANQTNGAHRRDQDGYFPIRCIKDI